MRFRILYVTVFFSCIGASPMSAQAETKPNSEFINFNIAAQPLSKALMTFGLQCGCAIVVPSDQLKDAVSSPIIGKMSKFQALSRLLKFSDFDYVLKDGRIVIIDRLKTQNKPPKNPPTYIEDDQEIELEELLVTGIRQSLDNSLRLKRQAIGVVDAISAEDIGKFPDSNLAESIQRIPGASINRVNGEGSKVTVRGFTGNYNQVTFNGRILPVIATPVDKIGDSRAFDFSNLASENIQSLSIYKTHSAQMATGGIGATIDIQSYKALSANTNLNYFSVKAMQDQGDDNPLSDNDNAITPELSGMFNWQPLDQLGISISGSWQKRKSGRGRAYVDQWSTNLWQTPGEAGAIKTHATPCADITVDPLSDRCITIVNAPNPGELYSLPSGLHYAIIATERERTNFLSNIQYQPHPKLSLSFDYALFDNKTEDQASELLFRLTDARSYIEFDNAPIKTPVQTYETFFSESGNASFNDLGFASQKQNLQNKTTSYGLNLIYKPSKRLNLNVDAHHSASLSGPFTDNYGTWANVRFGANVIGSQQINWSQDLPITSITINDDALAANNSNDMQLTAADIGSQVAFNSFSFQENTIDQLKLNAQWTSSKSSLDFGVDLQQLENTTRFSEIFYVMGDWGILDPAQLPDTFFSPLDIYSSFDDYNLNAQFNGAYAAQADDIISWAQKEYAERFPVGFVANPDLAVDRGILEETHALFIHYTHSAEFLDKQFDISAGLRYTNTETTTQAWVNRPTQITWFDNGDFDAAYAQNKSLARKTNNYDYFLPSLEFKWDSNRNLIARLAYSQSLARAEYAELSPEISDINVTGIATPNQTHAFAEAGNPYLTPLKSNNFDLSIEWYFAESSYLSFALYSKKINNFIGSEVRNQSLYGLRDASAGPRATAAREALTSSPDFDGVITDTDLFNQIAAAENNDFEPTSDPATYYGNTYDIEPSPADPEYSFAVLTPVNNKNAHIWGSELAAQYFFGESGFGLLANYTSVNGDISYDIAANLNTPQFALLGLSDTFNLVGIYEKHKWQARLAFNWRDEYLDSVNEEPVFVESYKQLDFAVGYAFSPDFSVSFEGINITEENSRSHGRTAAQLVALEQLSARYLLGLRYLF